MKIRNILLLPLILCSCGEQPFIECLLDDYRIKEGIEYFGSAASSVSIAEYVVFDKAYKEDSNMILNKYPYETASYRYLYDYNCRSNNLAHEDLLLSISYEYEIYNLVVNNIKLHQGFNEDINWEYNDFICYLNTEQDIHHPDSEPDTQISIDSEQKEIRWINFVAISEKRLTIAFVGFYYSINSSQIMKYSKKEKCGYKFREWSEFFNEFFSFYDWGKENS